MPCHAARWAIRDRPQLQQDALPRGHHYVVAFRLGPHPTIGRINGSRQEYGSYAWGGRFAGDMQHRAVPSCAADVRAYTPDVTTPSDRSELPPFDSPLRSLSPVRDEQED
jgi:hypothetical protein